MLTVTPVDDLFSFQQGEGAAELDVLSNDQISGDYLGPKVLTSVTEGSQGGRIQIIDNGMAIRYLPPPHFVGLEVFEYAIDGQFFGTVTVNISPSVRGDLFSVPPDTNHHVLDVLANDPFWSDYAGERKITMVGRSSLDSQVSISADGSHLTYQAARLSYGEDTFEYVVDNQFVATVVVSLSNPLQPDSLEVLRNADPTSINVIANDPFFSGYSGARRVTQLLDVPAGATATVAADGRSVAFTPADDFYGRVRLRYVVDGIFENVLTIDVVNPVADDNVTVDVNSTGTDLFPLANDVYLRSGVTYDVVDQITSVGASAEGGVVTLSADGLSVHYTPLPGFVGEDHFTYVADGIYSATVTVDVTPPVRDDQFSVKYGDQNVFLDVLAGDFVGSGYAGPKKITAVNSDSVRGMVSIDTGGTGIIYTPADDGRHNAGFGVWIVNRSDTFTYEVDGQYTAKVTVMLSNPVVNDELTVANQQTVTFDPLNNDSFGEFYVGAREITSVTQPDNGGHVQVGSDGQLTVETGKGNTTFTYTVDNDPTLTGTVTIAYPGWLVSDSAVADQNGEITLDLMANDFMTRRAVTQYGDYDGPRLITQIDELTGDGVATISADGKSVHYQPATDFVGTASFRYTVDGVHQSTATINVVRRVEDDVFHVELGSGANVLPVMLNDLLGADYRGASLISSVTADDPGATVSIGTDGRTLLYTPSANSDGEDRLVYTVDDKLVAEVTVKISDGQSGTLDPFDSDEALGEFLISSAIEHHYYHEGYPDAPFDDGLTTTGHSVGTNVPFSDTNTQVGGVDEADIVENDGEYLYTIAGAELVISRVAGATTLELASQTDLEATPIGLYLHGDRLAVVAERTPEISFPFVLDRLDPWRSRIVPETIVSVYDVSDRSHPKIVQTTRFDGRYIESRRIDSKVFVVTDGGRLELPAPLSTDDGPETQEAYATRMREEMSKLLPTLLPTYMTYDSTGALVRSGVLVDAKDIYRPVAEDAFELLSVSSLDMESSQAALLATQGVIAGSGSRIYGSQDNLYVFANHFDYHDRRDATEIMQFAWNGSTGNVDFSASGRVPGVMNDQFSADEYDGHLRIATTIRNLFAGNFSMRDENGLFVLQSDNGVLEPVGSLHNLALGEQIQSVRFDGERALVVTYRSFDPIFGVDLASAQNPYVVGALSLPGFLEYQQFIDADHILTIGQNAGGGSLATAVSLFDVGDLANPRLVDQADLPRGAASLAAADHHAFGWFAHHDLLALPSVRNYSVRVDADGDGYEETLESRVDHELFSYRVDVDADKPIELHSTVVEDSVIQRAAFVGDSFYAIATDSIQEYSIDDPSQQGDRIDWEFQPVDGPIWVPLEWELPRLADWIFDRAKADLADRLSIDASAVMLVTSEANQVVLRAEGQQYLYQGSVANNGVPDRVSLIEADFTFSSNTPRHNESVALDVNGDGVVSPLDALLTINELNEPREGAVRALSFDRSPWAPDTNGDGLVTPLDALAVINQLNTEPATPQASLASQATLTDLAFSADDDEEETDRRCSEWCPWMT